LISARAPPPTPLGELSTLPRPPSWILGGPISRLREERKGEEGKAPEGRERLKKRAGRGTRGGRERRERETSHPTAISGYATEWGKWS